MPVRTVSTMGSKARTPPQYSTSIAHDRIEAGTPDRSRSPKIVRLNERPSCSVSTPSEASSRSTRYSDGSCACVARASCAAVIGPPASRSAMPSSATT